jgi:hypothetical protein
MSGSLDNFHRRFWSKVDRGGPDECWMWTGAKDPRGYGHIQSGAPHSVNVYAHRAAWIMDRGEPLRHRIVMHRCDTPGCVNPRHLWHVEA